MCIFGGGDKSPKIQATPAPPATVQNQVTQADVPPPTQTTPNPAATPATSTSNQQDLLKTGRRSLLIPLINGGSSGLNIPG